jgi:hypothetical protein
MTDRQPTDSTPLFQNTDEQEQVYAPQQLPGAAQSDIADSDARTDDSPLVSGLVPVASAAGGSAGATGGVVGGGGAAPIVPDDPTQRELSNDDANMGDSARR